MKRGEVWWVNFDPSVGEEIRKKRPAVIPRFGIPEIPGTPYLIIDCVFKIVKMCAWPESLVWSYQKYHTILLSEEIVVCRHSSAMRIMRNT